MPDPTAARRLPGPRRSARCPGTRRRAGSTARGARRSAPRRAAPARPPPTPQRGAIGRPGRRRPAQAPHPMPPTGAPAEEGPRRGRRGRTGVRPCRSRDPRRAPTGRRRGEHRRQPDVAPTARPPRPPQRHRHARREARGEHVEGGRDGERIGVGPLRTGTAGRRSGACRRPCVRRTRERIAPPTTAPRPTACCSVLIVNARPVMWSDHSSPQQASMTPTTSSQPPGPPDSRKPTGSAPMSWPRPMPSTGRPASTARCGAGARHPRVDPRREPLPLDDVALRGAHQRGDRQPVALRQPPEQRQPLPMPGQRRRCGEAAQPRRDVGSEPGARGDGAQARRDRPVDLAGGDVERGHGMCADPQLADQHVQRALQRGRFHGAGAGRATDRRLTHHRVPPRQPPRPRAADGGQHHRHRSAAERPQPPRTRAPRRLRARGCTAGAVVIGATTTASANASAAAVTVPARSRQQSSRSSAPLPNPRVGAATPSQP